MLFLLALEIGDTHGREVGPLELKRRAVEFQSGLRDVPVPLDPNPVPMPDFSAQISSKAREVFDEMSCHVDEGFPGE